jgi:hypothetical protein
MNDTIAGAIIGAGATLAAVVVTQGLALGQRRVRERRERRNIRALLRLENASNLRTLTDLWQAIQDVMQPGGLGYSFDELAYLKRQKLANLLLEPWRHLMWESSVTRLASSLSPTEIERTYALHAALDTFTVRRADLQIEFATDQGERLANEYRAWRQSANQAVANQQSYVPSFQYGSDLEDLNRRTSALWSACEGIANSWPSTANPIHEDVSARTMKLRLAQARTWVHLKRAKVTGSANKVAPA